MTDDEQREQIVELGFRSEAIDHDCVLRSRALEPAWLSLADEANRTCQRQLHRALAATANKSVRSAHSFAVRLFIRTMSSFQAALALAERGLPLEARSLVRSCYENAILTAALVVIPEDALAQFEIDERNSSRARLALAVEVMENSDIADPSFVEDLRRALTRLGPREKGRLDLQDLAAKTDTLSLYLHFRQLSANSAHASQLSLHHHFVLEGAEVTGLQVGPDLDKLAGTIALALQPTLLSARYLSNVLADETLNADLDALIAKVGELIPTITNVEPLSLD